MELGIEFQISFGSIQTISMVDLGVRRVAAKFVSKLISEDEK